MQRGAGLFRAALFGSVAFGLAQAAHAQEARRAAATETPTVDEVIVTATRREQRLQDVPVAVTAVSGQALVRSNFREATDIQYLAPSVTFSATNPVANGGGYQIRGVGTQAYSSGMEQTVGLVVDGVVIGLSRDPGVTGFADVDRVEVLRGPQGTLFGKNSSAGVIQIITRNPRLDVLEGNADLSLGERSEQVAHGVVNLPVGDTLALRVAGFITKQDGPIANLLNDWHVGDRDNKGLRAKLLWQPNENLSVVLSGDYQKGFARDAQTIESLGTSAIYNSTFASFPIKPGHGVYLSYQDGDWDAHTVVDGLSLQVDYRLGDHTLTSITAHREVKTTLLADIDASPANIFNNSDGGVDSHEFTEELRLTSPSGQRLEYVLGGYYYDTTSGGNSTQYGNFYGLYGLPVVVGGGRRDEESTNHSLAAFGQATYALTDTLKVIGGLRYTHDRVTDALVLTPLPFPAIPLSPMLPYDGEVKADNVSGRLGLQYQPDRDMMLYATYATGYKGPGINAIAGVAQDVRPEHVKSYEAGLKSTLLDGRMIFDAAVYWTDFRDFQAQALDDTTQPPSFQLTNAGLLRTRGVELETTFKVTSNLQLSASGAYNDAKFRDFYTSCYTGQPVSAVVGVGCYVDPVTGLQVANEAGERLNDAPKWSYTLTAAYQRPLAHGYLFDANGNWAWRDDTQTAVGDPNSRVAAYGIFNANLGVGRDDGSWRFGLYARNLFNKHFYAPYAGGVLNPGGYDRVVSPDAFRTVGAKVSLNF